MHLYSFRIGPYQPDSYTHIIIECKNSLEARKVGQFAARCVNACTAEDMRTDPEITIIEIRDREQPGQGWRVYCGPVSEC